MEDDAVSAPTEISVRGRYLQGFLKGSSSRISLLLHNSKMRMFFPCFFSVRFENSRVAVLQALRVSARSPGFEIFRCDII